MNLIDNLTCKHCDKIYTEPTFLTCCGNNICKEDILLFKSSFGIFRCPICDTSTTNPKFQINKSLQVLINEAELHKFKLEPTYFQTLNEYKEKIAYIESIHKDPLNVIYEKISELKMDVDLDREKAKAEIDRLAETMMKKLNYLEDEFKAESSSKEISDYYDKVITIAKNNLNEYEKCLISMSFSEKERKKKRNDIRLSINYLNVEVNEYKTKLFNNKMFVYEPRKAGNIFGKLVVIVYIFLKYKLWHCYITSN